MLWQIFFRVPQTVDLWWQIHRYNEWGYTDKAFRPEYIFNVYSPLTLKRQMSPINEQLNPATIECKGRETY